MAWVLLTPQNLIKLFKILEFDWTPKGKIHKEHPHRIVQKKKVYEVCGEECFFQMIWVEMCVLHVYNVFTHRVWAE